MKQKDVKFNEMPIKDRGLILQEFGKYVLTLHNQLSEDKHLHDVHLYSLNSHFVETWSKNKKIVDIRIIIYKDLDKYLDLISIKNCIKK